MFSNNMENILDRVKVRTTQGDLEYCAVYIIQCLYGLYYELDTHLRKRTFCLDYSLFQTALEILVWQGHQMILQLFSYLVSAHTTQPLCFR